jgi:hypothetical protein
MSSSWQGDARVARIDLRPGARVVLPERLELGPDRKRQNFRAVARWMAKHPEGTIAGIDCNSPLLDLW